MAEQMYKEAKIMDVKFSIPIEYITRYTSNYTADENIRNFVKEIVSGWLCEEDDVYEHYSELEKIAKGEDV